MRLIDADALIEKVHDIEVKQYPDGTVYRHRCIDVSDVRDAPTIEPKQGEWIPLEWKDEETKCKCDFPIELDGHWVLVTDGKSISVERIKIDAIDHFYPQGRWYELEDVVAWMPLPDQYQKDI